MHISEGVLSAPVLGIGAAVAVAGLALGLRGLDEKNIVMCGVMSAAFFVASLIHVPIGIASAHLLLAGLCGILLGWGAFPAIFTALLLQALLFQYGGITTLGVNAATMGSAAVGAWYIFRAMLRILPGRWGLLAAAFCGGFCGVLISAILTASALAFTTEGFRAAAAALLLAHLPVMAAEGLISMLAVGFISRVKPGMLGIPCSRAAI